jgi:hypothetical protein
LHSGATETRTISKKRTADFDFEDGNDEGERSKKFLKWLSNPKKNEAGKQRRPRNPTATFNLTTASFATAIVFNQKQPRGSHYNKVIKQFINLKTISSKLEEGQPMTMFEDLATMTKNAKTFNLPTTMEVKYDNNNCASADRSSPKLPTMTTIQWRAADLMEVEISRFQAHNASAAASSSMTMASQPR